MIPFCQSAFARLIVEAGCGELEIVPAAFWNVTAPPCRRKRCRRCRFRRCRCRRCRRVRPSRPRRRPCRPHRHRCPWPTLRRRPLLRSRRWSRPRRSKTPRYQRSIRLDRLDRRRRPRRSRRSFRWFPTSSRRLRIRLPSRSPRTRGPGCRPCPTSSPPCPGCRRAPSVPRSRRWRRPAKLQIETRLIAGEKRFLCAWEPRGSGLGLGPSGAQCTRAPEMAHTRRSHPHPGAAGCRRGGAAQHARAADLSQFRGWCTLAAEARSTPSSRFTPGHAADVCWRRRRARRSAARRTSRRGGGALRSLRRAGSLDAPLDPGSGRRNSRSAAGGVHPSPRSNRQAP